MAKPDSAPEESATFSEPDAPAAVAAPAAPELTLDEFCIRLSATDRRPELLGGFAASQRAAGNVKSTEADFRQRFDEFVNKPV